MVALIERWQPSQGILLLHGVVVLRGPDVEHVVAPHQHLACEIQLDFMKLIRSDPVIMSGSRIRIQGTKVCRENKLITSEDNQKMKRQQFHIENFPDH